MSGEAEQKRRARAVGDAYRAGFRAGQEAGMPSVEELARALHETGLNEIGRAQGSHGKFTKTCICNIDAATILDALRRGRA